MEHNGTMRKALEGDINAFQDLFKGFQSQLKSYLYRLTANRNDAEDLTHDTFIKAFDKLSTFKAEATLKTWVFQIATNLAYNELRKRKRWTPDVSEKAKKLVLESEELQSMLSEINSGSPSGAYDIREHVDTCFTCVAKNLPIENQVAVLLKDVYGFAVDEIAQILDKTSGVAKYLLQDGRKVMTDVFEERCALVSKQGVCHQCSELNGWFNPRQNQQEALMKVDLVKGSTKYDREQLYEMRALLVSSIDPLQSTGHVLQEALLACNSRAMGQHSNS